MAVLVVVMKEVMVMEELIVAMVGEMTVANAVAIVTLAAARLEKIHLNRSFMKNSLVI